MQPPGIRPHLVSDDGFARVVALRRRQCKLSELP